MKKQTYYRCVLEPLLDRGLEAVAYSIACRLDAFDPVEGSSFRQAMQELTAVDRYIAKELEIDG